MTERTAPLNLAVLVGSARAGRYGESVARWFVDEIDGRDDVVVDTVDVQELALPPTAPALPPAMQRYDDVTAEYAARIDAAEAFVVVVPEYNHGYPAALKHAIDVLQLEWFAKPVAFVSYGGASGGVRAVEQLRQVFVELHAAPIRDQVAFPEVYAQFDPAGGRRAEGTLIGDPKAMLDELVWWGRALRSGREVSPYRP